MATMIELINKPVTGVDVDLTPRSENLKDVRLLQDSGLFLMSP